MKRLFCIIFVLFWGCGSEPIIAVIKGNRCLRLSPSGTVLGLGVEGEGNCYEF